MNRDDAKRILQMFKISYPNSFKTDRDKQEMSMFVNLWADAFKNIPSQVVFKAVKDLIYNDSREFAPNVAQVREHIGKTLAPDTDERALAAWDELKKFIRSTSSWNTKEEEMPLYNKLDYATKRLVSYWDAKDMAQLSKDKLEYRRHEFIQMYSKFTDKRNKQLLDEGNLIELADGTDRLLMLGYSYSEVMELQAPKPVYDATKILEGGKDAKD